MAKQKLPIKTDDLFLSPQDYRFVGEYVTNGYHEHEALVAAGLCPTNATTAVKNVRVMELMAKPGIKTAIERMGQAALDQYKEKLQSQIEIWHVRATYSMEDFYFPNGKVRPLDTIPKKLQHAIDSIVTDLKGKDADRETVNYKLADKAQAVKVLKELIQGATPKGSEAPTGALALVNGAFERFQREGGTLMVMQTGGSSEQGPKPVEGKVTAKTKLAEIGKRPLG